MTYSTTGRLFTGKSIHEFFEERRNNIIAEINGVNQNEFLNLGVEQFSDYLYLKYLLEYPVLHHTKPQISSYEKDIPGTRFPAEFGILDRNKLFKRDIIVFHIQFEGDISSLHYQPSSFYLSGVPGVTIKDNELLFEYINFYNESARIKREFDSDLQGFLNSYLVLKADFENYNDGLRSFILREIDFRKNSILQKNSFLSSFEIPLRPNDSVSRTFSIPSPALREKIRVTRPTASNSSFTPEPTLDYNNYQRILKIIDDAGRNFERHPSLYRGKGEEDLRDHILFLLDPHFESGSASGETFNKSGKTDILLRHDSSVVFIGECKFWSGEKGYLKTIDQLLNYLTWRDTKTAVIMFVQTKEVTPILKKIEDSTKTHTCYISTRGQKAENWIEHAFHLPIDKNKEIYLSVLVFHVPDL